jgi:hypothetical protein
MVALKKYKMTRLLTILFVLFYFIADAQTIKGRQVVDTFKVTAAGTTRWAGLVWKPTTYATSTARYPTIFFYHGAGEAWVTSPEPTNDPQELSDLDKIHGTALPMHIKNGWDAVALNPLTSQVDSFIVISVQAPTGSSQATHVKYQIADAITKYRIDTTRIYITGLSYGGASTLGSITYSDTTLVKRFAAAVPFAALSPSSGGGAAARLRYVTKIYGIAVLLGAGTADSYYGTSRAWRDSINILTPDPLAIRYGITGAGHSSAAWNPGYDPTRTIPEVGLNLYSWMLQYARVFTTSPTVNAGSDKVITLPTNTTSTTGTATAYQSRTLVSYDWSKVSGPATYNISSAATLATSFNNLVEGTYVFRLTVTDSEGEIGTDDITVVVNPAGTPPVSNAGADASIAQPEDEITVNGSASSDPDGSIVSYAWSFISGPTTPTINSPSSVSTVVVLPAVGSYTLRLTVTDNSGSIGTDDVVVTLTPPDPHEAPIITAQMTYTVTLPVDTLTIRSSATNVDGVPITERKWTKFKTPSSTPKKLGFIGSSTAQGTGAANIQRSFAYLMRNYYLAANLLSEYHNRALGGQNVGHGLPDGATPPAGASDPDTTRNISSLIRRDVDIAIVNYPGNAYDAMTISDIVDCHQTIYEAGIAAGIDMWIMGPQPREQFSVANKQKLAALNDSMQAVFGDRYIDVWTPFMQPGTLWSIGLYRSSDSLHFNDAGHRRLYEIMKAKNVFQSYQTSDVTIASPASANTLLSGLTQGVHYFQMGVFDQYGLAADTVIQVTVNPEVGCAGQRRTLSKTGSSVSVNGNSFTYNPGDTLVIPSSLTGITNISFVNVHGTPTCPVYVVNEGGQVLAQSIGFGNIAQGGCSYIKFLGNGHAGTEFGFKISTTDTSGVGVSFAGKTKAIEVAHIYIRDKEYGSWCKNEADCDTTVNNWTMDSIWVHDWKIRNTKSQGLYWGSTNPSGGDRSVVCNGDTSYPEPSRLDHLRVYNLDIDSTGRAGIQISAAQDRNNPGISEIYNNTLRNTGMQLDQAQGGSITMGGFTRAYVHNNNIKYAFLFGIWGVGATYTQIENNTIDSVGWHLGVDTTLAWNTNSYGILVESRPVEPLDSFQTIIKNNVIGVVSGAGPVKLAVGDAPTAQWFIYNGNIICGNKLLADNSAIVPTVDGTINYASNCAENTSPVANAGGTIIGRSPLGLVQLNGTASTDPDGNIASYNWQALDGGSIVNANQSTATLIGLREPGKYRVQLTVVDNEGSSHSVIVDVFVIRNFTRGRGIRKHY